MEYCIETIGLSHRFQRDQWAVNDLHLRVPRGSIYGFLGPNGAGKTTTLRLLLGLVQAQTGDIRLFGKSFKHHRVELLRRIGSLIESPSIYAHLSAIENLKVWQPLYGVSSARLAEVLQLVDLQDTGKKKAGHFSLGMKQRLSIAIALLHQPELLILDEPTNGLDPQGIIEMRELLKRLNQEQGITIIVSSHLLSEIEKLVTHLGVIHHGKMRFQGTLSELHQLEQNAQSVQWRTGDNERAAQLIGAYATLQHGVVVTPLLPPSTVASINQRLIENGIALYDVRTQQSDLESIFLELIQS